MVFSPKAGLFGKNISIQIRIKARLFLFISRLKKIIMFLQGCPFLSIIVISTMLGFDSLVVNFSTIFQFQYDDLLSLGITVIVKSNFTSCTLKRICPG